jgi:dUTP pyrophosphatase
MGDIHQRSDGTRYIDSAEFAESKAFNRLYQCIKNKSDKHMETPQVLINPLYDDAQVPEQMTDGSVGLDLYAHRVIAKSGAYVWYGTGIAATVQAPFALFAFARSSISETDPRVELANGVGVIDRDYRGEIQVRFNYTDPKRAYGGLPYKERDRIAQMVPMVAPTAQVIKTSELDETERGDAGFGSTGN